MLIFKLKNPVIPFPNLPPPPPPTGGREKGKEKLDFAARTLTLNKQYLHSSHQIYNEKYYLMYILASDFFEKDDKYVFKARNLCCVQGIFSV